MIFEEKIIITKSDNQTQNLGFKFSKKITPPAAICLYGDLGSGKTTFTKGFAKGLGIKERIISPTFVIVREHEAKKSLFYHIDLYRIENEKELKKIGINDLFLEKKAIVLIEWAENLDNLLPKKRWDIKFEQIEKNKRRITITSNF